MDESKLKNIAFHLRNYKILQRLFAAYEKSEEMNRQAGYRKYVAFADHMHGVHDLATDYPKFADSLFELMCELEKDIEDELRSNGYDGKFEKNSVDTVWKKLREIFTV